MNASGIAMLRAILIFALLGAAGQAAAGPFEGAWAGSRHACRDPDSPDRLLIQDKVLQWYETRCVMRSFEQQRGGRRRMHLSCRGEGRSFQARPSLSLHGPDRLVIEDSPVEPVKRQTYRRCLPR